jgi:hypothetical protein
MHMTKWTMLALLTLAVSAVPAFAAEAPAPGNAEMKQMMHQHPELMKQMMQNPQHKLAMAYHKNLVTFAQALKKVARQGETVPRDFARAAVTEMRRSADQMEIYHEAALGSMPAESKATHGEMAKTMAGHLAEMRTQLMELDALTKGDRVDSKEVLKHLHVLLKGCEGMCHDEGMCPKGMRGEGHQGMHGKGMNCGCMHKQGGCMHDRDCKHCGKHEGMQGDCMHGAGMQGDCMHGEGMHGPGMQGHKMRGGAADGWQEMMQQRHKMMDAMRVQDAELSKLVDAMNAAPNDKKQAVMAEVLTRLVKQRADMDAQLEKLQEHMKHHMEGEMQHHSMQGMEADDDSEDGNYDSDSNDTNEDDMDSDDADSSDSTMDMKDMHMQDTGK